MLPFVQDNVPELLLQGSRVAFCGNLHLGAPRDRFRSTSTLLLARNLKFYEFRRKELLHHIDLRGTRLQQVASQLEAYEGPMSAFLPTVESTGGELDCSRIQAPKELPLKFGKFVWQQEEIYLLIQCWSVLLVLRRPKEHGSNFELVAQHDDVVAFKMAHGPIPYQAVVELHFGNGKRQCCDFQEPSLQEEGPSTSKAADLAFRNFESLEEQVNAARAELATLRLQTQKDFELSQDLQQFGPPGQRSLLLEEKQPLRRFGDVWTRVCGDYLVCGTLLVNLTGSHRLSIVQDVCPLVRLEPHRDYSLEHRLYELPLQADGQPPLDYDQLAQFWACQDQHSRQLKWRPVAKAGQLPPECSAVMVVRLNLVDLLEAEQLQLMVLYEIKGSAEQEPSARQMHLVSFDVKKLLDEPESLAPNFSPATLHQDFLAVIMTQTARCSLKLEFNTAQDCEAFEQLLASKLQFESIQAQEAKWVQDSDLLEASCAGAAFQSSTADSSPVQRIFYNRQPLSQWCGILLLRDDPGQLWHVYAQTDDRLRLLLHRLMRDLLQLHCNLTVLEVSEYNQAPADVALELEASLNEELEAWKEVLKPATSHEQSLERLTHLHQVQMASDVLASVILSPNASE
ncbi:uncharacterized protein LOC128260999 isoform X1 [Drosophila gunungcola]|uniref:Uncharacterized protein n=1 Tax=Drosophila gunungcola TaxID=103775 RepID=A0A9P9YE23_9MUSC|nr:uncharacterized protein LOC128260999 isoform X1 [Drosophila gunungcola]KAI8035040.1 hypothetical protein M5D96_012133 [Drosophila gunungcola]